MFEMASVVVTAMDAFVVMFADVLDVTFVETFAAIVVETFAVTFADVFVCTTVIGTGVVVTFAGAVVNAGTGVSVVSWVGRAVRGF
jgi:hypothetical protein